MILILRQNTKIPTMLTSSPTDTSRLLGWSQGARTHPVGVLRSRDQSYSLPSQPFEPLSRSRFPSMRDSRRSWKSDLHRLRERVYHDCDFYVEILKFATLT